MLTATMPGQEEASSDSAWRPIDCVGMEPNATPKSAMVSRAETALLVAVVAAVGCLFYARYAHELRGTDFPDFYCAARMLIEGHGHELYNVDAQRAFQLRYAGRVGTLYIHPPFEVPLYLMVAWLPLRQAYLLWCLLNLGLLALAAQRLARFALPGWNWRVLLSVWLAFVPVLLSLLQGQDSIVLLLLLVLGFGGLRSRRDLAAGCWLGLGLFKFQIVLPMAVILALQRGRGSFVRGFVLTGLALAGVSAAISGWGVFAAYPRFLLHLEEQSFAGVVPVSMANFRGLAALLLQGAGGAIAVAILSIAAMVLARMAWKRAEGQSGESGIDLAYGNTVIVAVLVSYHLNPHDLSLFLLPLSVLAYRWHATRGDGGRWLIGGMLAILFLPPVHLWALRTREYAVVGVLVIALLVINTWLVWGPAEHSS